jgi:hypothetical protein
VAGILYLVGEFLISHLRFQIFFAYGRKKECGCPYGPAEKIKNRKQLRLIYQGGRRQESKRQVKKARRRMTEDRGRKIQRLTKMEV